MKGRSWVTILTALGICISLFAVLGVGYFAWSSLTGVVESVRESARPDLRLALIKEIAYDLTEAENSVKTYSISRDTSDLDPYYHILGSVDVKLDSLHFLEFAYSGISLPDTLETLIGEEFDILDSLLNLRPEAWISARFERTMDELGKMADRKAALARDAPDKGKGSSGRGEDGETDEELEKKKSGILSRLFKKKRKEEADREHEGEENDDEAALPAPEQVISELDRLHADMEELREQEAQMETLLRIQELRLHQRSRKVRDSISRYVHKLENQALVDLKSRSESVQEAAGESNKFILLFSIAGGLVLILTAFGIVIYIRRNNEQKEAIRMARAAAEKSVRDKERFLADMSHEIRTPMNAIVGFSEQMLHEKNEDKRSVYLRIIRDASLHLLQVVNAILDYSRLESGKIELSSSAFRVSRAVDTVIELFRQEAERKGLYLKSEISENVPEVVWGDLIRFRQILINLISNAVKFTDQGGVSVSLDAKARDGEPGNVDLYIRVQDTGVGIPRSKLESIFEEYEQAHEDVSARLGTGLGLNITRRLVGIKGGTIKVESEPGQGTTFIVCLPRTVAGESDIEDEHEDSPVDMSRLQGMKVLLADDEVYNRILLITLMRKWGIHYVEASNGQEAWEAFLAHDFDLLLLDLRMPLLTGIELLAKIRESGLGVKSETPAVGLTAASDANELDAMRDAGFARVLTKPFQQSELFSVLSFYAESLPPPESAEMSREEGDTLYDLSELRGMSGGDEIFVREMVRTFQQSAKECLSGMQAAIRAQDPDSLGDLAHKLAPSARHLGADALYALLKEIESGTNGQPGTDQMKTWLTGVAGMLERLNRALDQEIGDS